VDKIEDKAQKIDFLHGPNNFGRFYRNSEEAENLEQKGHVSKTILFIFCQDQKIVAVYSQINFMESAKLLDEIGKRVPNKKGPRETI
jgi:hypothetical protein